MKSDIKYYPESSKETILPLISKFFQDILLTQKEYIRDKKSFEQNQEIWQKFIKSVNEGDLKNNQHFDRFVLQMQSKLQEVIKNIKDEYGDGLQYLNELNYLLTKQTQLICNFPHTDNINISQDRQTRSIEVRQIPNSPKPNQQQHNGKVEKEDSLFQEQSYKIIDHPIRSHKKTLSSNICNSKQKYFEESNNNLTTQKKQPLENGSTFKYNMESASHKYSPNDSKKITANNTSSLFNLILNNKKGDTSEEEVEVCQNLFDQSEVIELIVFLNSNNAKNYTDSLKGLFNEKIFLDHKNVYALIHPDRMQNKKVIMDQFIQAINISHYQDIIQNSTQEKWESLFKIIYEQQLSCQKIKRSDSDQPTQIISQLEAKLLNQYFLEMHLSIMCMKDTKQQLFKQFLQKVLSDDQFNSCLQASLKEQILVNCKLNDNKSNQDIFSNWFIQSTGSNTIVIDSQKLQLLSSSLKKRITIFKVTSTTDFTNKQSSSTTSFEVFQPFEANSTNPSINILWHNTETSNHFYPIMNEHQKQFYTYKNQIKEVNKNNSSIKIREISLQKCIFDQNSNSRREMISSPFSLSNHTQRQEIDTSFQPSLLSNLSINPLSLQKNSSSTFIQLSCQGEQGFTSDSRDSLKLKTKQLKLMMLENYFNINSLLFQFNNECPPPNQFQQNHQLLTPKPPLPYTHSKGGEQMSTTKIKQVSYKSSPAENEPNTLSQIPSYNSFNTIKILGIQNYVQSQQDDQKKRLQEYSHTQIKLLSGQNIRSLSQNQFLKTKDEPMINLQHSHQHVMNKNPHQNVQHYLPHQDGRLRIQSGHLPSTNQAIDDKQPQTNGIRVLLATTSSLKKLEQVNNQVNDKIKNDQAMKDDSLERNKGQKITKILGNANSQNIKYSINTLNTQFFQNDHKSGDGDKNILKLLGLTPSKSTTATPISSTNAATQPQLTQLFLQNPLLHLTKNNNSNIYSSQRNQGIQLIKSVSTSPNLIPQSSKNCITNNKDSKLYQDFQMFSKLNTYHQIRNQEINERGVLQQQKMMIS